MARPSSKILTLAEKKTAEAGLKTVLKATNEQVKASASLVDDANKALALAKKTADAQVKASNKAHDAVLKATGKAIADAQKIVDSVAKKHTKVFDAAAKGKEKVTAQLATLAAAPVAGKTKAPAKAGTTAS